MFMCVHAHTHALNKAIYFTITKVVCIKLQGHSLSAPPLTPDATSSNVT